MDESEDAQGPFLLFDQWFEEARSCGELREPTAMSLATVFEDMPAVRIVLLKEWDARGFVFYTNLGSAKSKAIRANPNAALCFYWMPLAKQVRISGRASPVETAQADAYFASRDRMSQIGAWASVQSEAMPSPDALKQRIEEMQARFEGGEIPRPPHWSGWRIVPQRFEFWHEGAHRLHRRVAFEREGDSWRKLWLYP